jgi:hypothetical protein
MLSRRLSLNLGLLLAGFAVMFIAMPGASAQKALLHNFGGNSADGKNPFYSLTLDSAGNLYGTTPAPHTKPATISSLSAIESEISLCQILAG